jgi:hypothetical protein
MLSIYEVAVRAIPVDPDEDRPDLVVVRVGAPDEATAEAHGKRIAKAIFALNTRAVPALRIEQVSDEQAARGAGPSVDLWRAGRDRGQVRARSSGLMQGPA